MIAPTCGCRVVLTGRGGRVFGLIDYCRKHAAVDELLVAAKRVALLHEAPEALKRAIAQAEGLASGASTGCQKGGA